MKNPTLYIVINKSLNMSIGKVASQAAHAAAMAFAAQTEADNDEWLKSFQKTVIVLEARNEAHLRNLQDYLRQRGLVSELIIDEGVNEILPLSITALVTPYMEKELGDQLFNTLRLYNHGEVPSWHQERALGIH